MFRKDEIRDEIIDMSRIGATIIVSESCAIFGDRYVVSGGQEEMLN